MKRNLTRLSCGLLALLMLTAVGCGKKAGTDSYSVNNYTYEKKSENLVYYESSDESLDFFLNDYYKRHAGGIYEEGLDQKVESVGGGLGSQQLFWQEWMSLAFYPISSLDGNHETRIEGLRKMLSGVPVDRYGYVWQESDLVRDALSTLTTGEHRMGWPFPTSHSMFSEGMSTSWDFNGNDKTAWSSNVGATLKNGLFTADVDTPVDTVEFTSPVPANTYEEICAYYTPLLEIDLRMYTSDFQNIEDVYVWYTTNDSPDWSEDKKVSVNEKAFIAYDYTPIYEHMLFLPMYAEEEWESDKDLNSYIRQIKVEIVPKEGETVTGNFGLSYVRCAYDTRHSNNNSLLISSLRQDYDYTGDIEYLTENITRARKAINFYMSMYDEERHLNDQSYLVGHDADKTSEFKSDKIAMSLGNGYWDISFMPKYDFYSNVFFYKALVDLAYLEGILESKGVHVDKSLATVLTADRQFNHGENVYNHTSESLQKIANDVLTELRKPINESDKTGFWNPKTGRFVAGYAEAEDKWYDYGYTAWNMEAIYYGVATDEQAKTIMDWISGERIVEEDKYGSQGEDIYFFELAPRSNTRGEEDPFDTSVLGNMYCTYTHIEYGKTNVQNGGAIMYTSFYDLMSRIQTYGADNAYERLSAIKDWHKDIYDYYVTTDNYNKHPDRFYWDYYENSQWDSDGDGVGEYWAIQNSLKGAAERKTADGAIGIDGEFLESILPIAAIPYGFFGVDSLDGTTLQVTPRLPSALEHWKMENLSFGGAKYDLVIFDNAVMITSIRGKTADLEAQVVLDAPKSGQKVYVNGKATNRYSVKDGKVYVTLPLRSVTVEVK
ncbi:MAG: hypothetical protein IJX49_03180 [Clostridia bacterium]|nr:hypothetical protein [Clostridia bacterium]